MSEVVLSLKNITKIYPGVIALNSISLDFHKGEVHALLGENGAGKSTLIKVISGAITPDEGIIAFGNKQYSKLTPHIARMNGVEVIYQEFNLISSISAAENICLGDKFGRFVNYREMERKAWEIFGRFKVSIDPCALIRDLSTSEQQIVEIAKAVSRKVRILIMDEPSAPLSVSEVESMFNIIREFKRQGVTVIYISHRIDELFAISDRVTVMRDGFCVDTKNTSQTTRKELISLMVGRELKESYPSRNNRFNEVAFELKNVSGNGNYNISFKIRKGEILGVAGLVGAGRTELAKVIYGAEKLESGEIYINGHAVRINSPSEALRHGIGLIPENRKEEGCFLEMSVKWNISFANIKNLSKMFIVDIKKEDELGEKYMNLLNIKTPSLYQQVKNLSGGNQQKVVLAKTLAANSIILIFDEPTRGIDVGAKQEIYKLMCQLVGQGHSIMMITSDMEELLGMSDRIIILSEGKLTGVVENADFSQDYILELASGLH